MSEPMDTKLVPHWELNLTYDKVPDGLNPADGTPVGGSFKTSMHDANTGTFHTSARTTELLPEQQLRSWLDARIGEARELIGSGPRLVGVELKAIDGAALAEQQKMLDRFMAWLDNH